MHIVHITPYYAPAWAYGGVVRAVYGLATAQAAAGQRVSVITTDSLSPVARSTIAGEMIDGVTVYRIRNRIGALRRLNLSSPVGLGDGLSRLALPPDVLHCHELRTVENLLMLSNRRVRSIPAVLSPHGTLPQDTGRQSIKRLWDTLFGQRLAARFSGVLALTDDEARLIGDWWPRFSARLPRVAILPNGVDLPDLHAPTAVVTPGQVLAAFPRRAPGNGHHARTDDRAGLTVLFMGRLHERKGVQLLIAAFAQAAIPNSRLLIVGPDEGMRPALETLAAQCGVSERVTFTGYLTGTMRDEAYARADVFALPAIGEGLSIAALEAMAAGLPVILTPGCHLPEAETMGAGWIVERAIEPLAAALRSLLTDAPQREMMGAAGRHWMAEAYSWLHIAAQSIAFYDEVLRAAP